MPKIIKNDKIYSGVPLETLTAWPDTGDSASVAQPLMGNTDISGIGDGTVTGAVKAVANQTVFGKYAGRIDGITASTVLKITRSSGTQVYLVSIRGTNGSSWCNALVSGYSGGSPRNAIISLGRGSYVNEPTIETSNSNDLTLKFTFNSGISESVYISVIPYLQNDSFTVTKE